MEYRPSNSTTSLQSWPKHFTIATLPDHSTTRFQTRITSTTSAARSGCTCVMTQTLNSTVNGDTTNLSRQLLSQFSICDCEIPSKPVRPLPGPRQLMAYSLLAGVIGLDMKCSHCAASHLTADNAAASEGALPSQRFDAIYAWLVAKESDPTLFCAVLFAWEIYERLVLSEPCSLYFFPDDMGETVFDLFRLQEEMKYNHRLRVTFVPRNGRFHNDCALEDVDRLLERSCFEVLRHLREKGEFVVNPNGPKNSAVEAPKMSRRLVDAILDDATVLFFKGARSYEMIATGIRIPTFSGQTVSREFSESVTGASATAGVPVLRYFRAFPDYWGFAERHRRVEPLFPTGQPGWQAAMTAVDSARFTVSKEFLRACSKRERLIGLDRSNVSR